MKSSVDCSASRRQLQIMERTRTHGTRSVTDAVVQGACTNNTVLCSSRFNNFDGSSPMNLSLGHSGPFSWKVVKDEPLKDSTIVLDICVSQPLPSFSGQFHVTLNVSNEAGRAALNLSITIDDVNQAPKFLTQNQQTISVAENTPVGTSVAELRVILDRSEVTLESSGVIYVWEPDKAITFAIKDVIFVESTTTFPEQAATKTTVADQSAITLRTISNTVYTFKVLQTLTAGSNISVTVQALDKGGLSATGTVQFVILEVNQPPQCANTTYTDTLNVASSLPGLAFVTIQCSDTSSLTYTEVGTNADEYFTVSSTGIVSVEKLLPLDVRRLTYKVRVTDAKGLATNVIVNVTINSDSPPECNNRSGRVILTKTYKGIQCHNVTLNCSHVPGLLGYGLTVNYTFSYNTALFRMKHYPGDSPSGQQTNGVTTVEVCARVDSIDRTVQHDWDITVSSETGTTRYPSWKIAVVYLNQSPRFDQSQYTFAVAETTSVMTIVASVLIGSRDGQWRSWVTSDGQSGGSSVVSNGVYVVDPDTDPNFALKDVVLADGRQYLPNGTWLPILPSFNRGIRFSEASKHFTVDSNLSAGDRHVFNLTALDSAGAQNNASVVIRVTDVNQRPSCPAHYVSLTVNLTSAIGLDVHQVVCTDPDVDPKFNSITYSMNGVGTAAGRSYFSIDGNTGWVKLTSLLPTHVRQLTYNVIAQDGGMLASDVNLTIVVNRDYPPDCTPPSPVNVTFMETNASGVCTNTLVTCIDTSGRSLPLEFDVKSNETQGNVVLINANTAHTNTTAFKACVQGLAANALLRPGEFQMVAEVNNSLRVTSVIFSVTIVDINQPPYFEKSKYEVTVPDTVPVKRNLAIVRLPSEPQQADVINIVRGDPDTVTSSYVITSMKYSVRAVYVNGTAYDVSGGEPIKLVQSNIVVEQTLRPDVIYICTLTVMDGEGLSANATLEVRVSDVNQAPSCQGPWQSALDLLQPLDTPTLLRLSSVCGDQDHNLTFKSLSYFAYNENDASYFNVSENGDVTLVTSVPRDAMQLTLKAYAIDGGGLADNVTIYFNISRHYPPKCIPAYVPPNGVWERDTCFRIYPNCSDPSTPGGDKTYLVFSFTGTWSTAFRQSASPNATHLFAEFCYILTFDGSYTVRMHVSNGLGTYSWSANIHVSIRQAPPKFTINRYIAELNETAPMGFPLLTVEALVAGRNASLVYSLTGSGGLNQYFSINDSIGQISVAVDLSPLVATRISGHVAVSDPQTGLNHSVPLSIKVLDVNQPPSCRPLTLTSNIIWGVKVSDTVATLNCSDPDPTPGFSRLTYSVTSGGDKWRSDQSKVRLISRALLEPDRSLYLLTVAASDGVYHASVSVTVNVDMTPPKPVVSVSDVRANSVNITWTFDEVYEPVIDRFAVSLTGSPNSASPRNHGKNVRTYVIANLTSQQQYAVRVTVRGACCNVSSDDVPFVTPSVAVLSKACTEIHLLQEPWIDALSNNQSVEFRNLQDRLTLDVDTALRGLRGYVNCKIRSLRSGSVYADVVLTTNQSLNDPRDLKSAVIAMVTSGSVGNFIVNRTYFPFYIKGSYIVGPTASYESKGKFTDALGIEHLVSGSEVTVTCSGRTPGQWNPVFEWQVGNRDVSSLSGGPQQLYVVSPKVWSKTDIFRVTSTLTIKQLNVFDKNRQTLKVTCRLPHSHQTDARDFVTFRVVDRVTATLTPPTALVTSGSDVTFTCARIAGYPANWTAEFYRVDGESMVKVLTQQVGEKENTTELTLKGVTSGDRYQCDVTDPYSSSRSNEAAVIIRPPDAVQCPADGVWQPTPAGNTVKLHCPDGYNITGLQRRTCKDGGQWGNVDTSQCVLQILQDYKNQIERERGELSINETLAIVGNVANATSGPLLTGDVIAVTDILNEVVKRVTDTKHVLQTKELADYVTSADNTLQTSKEVWQNQTSRGLRLVHDVDKMGKAAIASEAAVNSEPIQTKKIVLEVGRAVGGGGGLSDIHFPNPKKTTQYDDWVIQTNISVFLSKYAFPQHVTEVKYSAIIFRNLTNVFYRPLDQSLTGQSELSINSPILSLSLSQSQISIQRPVQLTFQHILSNFSSTSCQFLNFSVSEEGTWSDVGCRVNFSDSERTECLCDHLTNFAVLMSPYRPTTAVADVLNIFSIVGCGVSIFCLILTIIIYRIFWRFVKSDRSVILMNLCVILILAYVTFLAGVNRVQYETLCTAVAVLLYYLWPVVICLMLCDKDGDDGDDYDDDGDDDHDNHDDNDDVTDAVHGGSGVAALPVAGAVLLHYLWLVVFCLMLCEGLDIFISIVIIFPTKSVLLKLLLMAYGVPLIIIGASMGITQLEGYGGDDFCWLSLKNNLLWAFVGPALAALLANFVFVALVIRALLSTTAMITKANRERAKSVVRAICVMTPILGLAWIFGVMAVNHDTVLFQVLFVVFNSLQGLMIFIFHCLLSKQVREGFEKKRRQRMAKHSGDSAASKYVSQKRTSESSVSSNDMGKSTSPFIQADRQVQRMATKMSLLDSPNLLTLNDPPKVAALKDPVAGTTGPGLGESFLNIQPSDPGMGQPSQPPTPARGGMVGVGAGFRIESGNLTSFCSSSHPPSSSLPYPNPLSPPSASVTTTTTAVVEKESVRHSNSLEDNAQQGPDMGQIVADQQSRLDQVYGAGARVSTDPNSDSSRPYAQSKGGCVVQSAESVAKTSPSKNATRNNAMPSTSPADRWHRAAQAVARHHHQPHRGPSHTHQQPPFPQQGPHHPSSPRRLSTSADGMAPSSFFSGPRQGEIRYVSGKKHPPPQTGPKPSGWRHHEPPVDYW
ncbi:hypothetical protein ACOMHN_043133 [Nucella lapillus]